MASARTLQYASPVPWTIGNPYRNNCVITQVAPSIVLILAIMSALNLVCLMEGGQDVFIVTVSTDDYVAELQKQKR
jgi:hypothetical protein